MVLILDLIAILFIVILSYCLCMRNSNVDSSSMLSHIVIGLSVIIFYKLVKHFKLSEKFKYMNTNNGNTYENFYSDTVSQSINDFISNNNINIITSEQAAALSPSDLTAYNNNITTLIDNINQLKQQMQSPQVANQITPENLNTLDLSAQQQYQMFQINYLQDQIKKSQDTINAKTVASSSQNYKPIKIFSSCVVSNTNGTTTVEQPVNNSNTSSMNPNMALTQNSLERTALSPAAQNMMTTINQSSNQTAGPALNMSSSSGAFGSFLANLSKFGSANINA